MKIRYDYTWASAGGFVLALLATAASAAPPTGTVKVVNGADEPIPAAIVDAPPVVIDSSSEAPIYTRSAIRRYTAQVNLLAFPPAEEVCHGTGPLVPDGKRFVIESVWANVTDPQGNESGVPPNLYLFGVGASPFIPLTLGQAPADGAPPNDLRLWAGALESTRMLAGPTLSATDDELGQAEPISGAHMNPVVTLPDASQAGLPWRDVPAYVGGQVLGAFVGVAVADVMFAEPMFSLSEHARAGLPQLVSELVA